MGKDTLRERIKEILEIDDENRLVDFGSMSYPAKEIIDKLELFIYREKYSDHAQ